MKNTEISKTESQMFVGKPNHFSSFSTYLTSTVGVTILLMPKLFHQAGIIFGSIQIIVMGIVIYFSTSMLCHAAKMTQSRSYYETTLNLAGRYKFIVSTLYLLLLYGNILVYQSFALKNFIPIVNKVLNLGFTFQSKEYIIMGVIVTILCNFMILPFLFSRKLRIVKIISNVCAAAVLFSFVVIIILFAFPELFDLKNESIDWSQVSLYKMDGLFVCTGYYLLSFCFQQIAIEVSVEIRPETQNSTNKIIFWNCFVSSSIYLIVSFVGYLTVYKYPKLDEMNNFITFIIFELGNNNKMLFLIDVLIIFSVTFANILNYIPTIRYLKVRFNKKPEALNRINSLVDSEFGFLGDDEDLQKQKNSYLFFNRIIVWLLFIFVLGLNLVITIFDLKLDFVFNLVSAIGGPAVLIVIPAFFYLTILRNNVIEKATIFQYFKCFLTLILGLIFWAVSIIAVFVV